MVDRIVMVAGRIKVIAVALLAHGLEVLGVGHRLGAVDLAAVPTHVDHAVLQASIVSASLTASTSASHTVILKETDVAVVVAPAHVGLARSEGHHGPLEKVLATVKQDKMIRLVAKK